MSRLSAFYLSDVYSPRVNGVSTSIATFRRELAVHGVDITLLAPAYGDEPAEEGIVRLAGRRVPFDPEDRFVRPRRFVAAAGVGCDLIHVQTPFAAHRAGVRLASALRVPLVETWHTDFEHYFEHYLPLVPRGLARGLARSLARRVGREVDRLIVPSSAVAQALTAAGVRAPTCVVPTGLSPEELGPGDGARFRARFGIAPDRPVAVHVGRLAREKNVEFLLDVVALVRHELPDFLLIVAGEGPARERLVRQVRELSLERHVLFLGYLDRRRELADCYRAGDCFVLASQTETQGLVLLEAMSLGVPVVALAARGTVDLLAAGEGALTPPPEVPAFAAALVWLLGDHALRSRLGAQGRRLAARWSAGELAGRLAKLYRELVEPGQAQASTCHAAVTGRR